MEDFLSIGSLFYERVFLEGIWLGGRSRGMRAELLRCFWQRFSKQPGEGVGTVRVVIQRRPWRSMTKIAVHGNFPLVENTLLRKSAAKNNAVVPLSSLCCCFVSPHTP